MIMLAYLFWHVPFQSIESKDYEAALLKFQSELARTSPQGLASCSTYRISEVHWLNGRRGYEDWYFVDSSAALDVLNKAAVNPQRWDVHAAVADKMEFGYGGLYEHLQGEAQSLDGMRAVWLKRPRGIRYEQPLRELVGASTGVLSCWRRQMTLGPGDEFVVIGTWDLNLSVPPSWKAQTVERTRLALEPVSA
jgi:hypothetical protein